MKHMNNRCCILWNNSEIDITKYVGFEEQNENTTPDSRNGKKGKYKMILCCITFVFYQGKDHQ